MQLNSHFDNVEMIFSIDFRLWKMRCHLIFNTIEMRENSRDSWISEIGQFTKQ